MVIKKKSEDIYDEILKTDDEWFSNVSRFAGVVFVDAYQKWSGPCTVLTPFLKAIREEISVKDLKLVAAECEEIDSLKFYKGHSIPTFLFYCHGKMRDVVRGMNWPAINRSLQNTLVTHDSFMNLEIHEIEELFDPEQQEWLDKKRQEYEKSIVASRVTFKQCALLVIKPDVVQKKAVQEVFDKLTNEGFEVVTSEDRVLTKGDVDLVYGSEDKEADAEIVNHMTSGPSEVLVVTKGARGVDIVELLQELVGPEKPQLAREKAPASLRAKYGTDDVKNAIYVSPSKKAADTEIEYFYPELKLPQCGEVKPDELEQTLVLIRPDGYKTFGKEILEALEKEKFIITMKKEYKMTAAEVKDFYVEKAKEIYFQDLVDMMISGPVLVCALARENALSHLKRIIGPPVQSRAKSEQPDSLRARFSIDKNPGNSIHAPDSLEQSRQELLHFFPVEATLVVIKPNRNARVQKKMIVQKIKEAGFKVQKVKVYRFTVEDAEDFYCEHKKQPYFAALTKFMNRHDSVFLVVSKQYAIRSFIDFAGDKDPEIAKKKSPGSLRAMFGENIIGNAIDRTSSAEEYVEKMSLIFDPAECETFSDVSSFGSLLGADATTRFTGRTGVSGYSSGGVVAGGGSGGAPVMYSMRSKLSMINREWAENMNVDADAEIEESEVKRTEEVKMKISAPEVIVVGEDANSSKN